MHRPVGVTLLALFFIGLSLWMLAILMVAIVSELPTEPYQQVGLAGMLTVTFMIGALGAGLWDLHPDARYATIGFSWLVAAFFFAMTIESAMRRYSAELPYALALTVLFALPAIYLYLPKVKNAFAELTIVRLHT